jgi:hypothetical protein
VRWLVLPAFALAFAGTMLLWPAGAAREGDVIAAEPRVVSIGERAVAEMSGGANLRWSGDDVQQEVQQDSGAVTYRVLPGAGFRVQTPYGSVAVLGGLGGRSGAAEGSVQCTTPAARATKAEKGKPGEELAFQFEERALTVAADEDASETLGQLEFSVGYRRSEEDVDTVS